MSNLISLNNITMNTLVTRKLFRGKFQYYSGNTKITDKNIIDYINKIRIPPAWKNVKISLNKKSKKLAVGTDAAGRVQVIYNKCFILKNKKIRACNIIPFIKKLPEIREDYTKLLSTRKLSYGRAIATIISLMDTCCPLRIGNQFYKKKYNTYGLSTLEKRHITFNNKSTLTISFIGKKHQLNTKIIHKKQNKLLFQTILQFYNNKKNDTDSVFSYIHNNKKYPIKSKNINDFLKQYGNFSAKDFRTLRANICLIEKLKKLGPYANKSQMKKFLIESLDYAADTLNNTRAICKSNYIIKPVITMYENHKIKFFRLLNNSTNNENNLVDILELCASKRAINF